MQYFLGKVNENKSSSGHLWNTLKSLILDWKSKPPLEIRIDGNIQRDLVKIANAFNKLFTTVGQSLAQKLSIMGNYNVLYHHHQVINL